MAEVGGKPFLDRLIGFLETNGIGSIILCTGFMSAYISDHYSRKAAGAKIIFSVEDTPLGTAGALKLAESKIKSDPFFILNGDSYCEADLGGMLDFHRSRKAEATILLSKCRNSGDYGSVKIDDTMRITGFKEKETCAGEGLVNAGVYLFNKELLGMIPAGKKYSTEYDLFPKLGNLYGFESTSGFIDIGTKERYEKAGCLFKNEKDK
jgi:NDP-sugar pyrophosphorylase family protein